MFSEIGNRRSEDDRIFLRESNHEIAVSAEHRSELFSDMIVIDNQPLGGMTNRTAAALRIYRSADITWSQTVARKTPLSELRVVVVWAIGTLVVPEALGSPHCVRMLRPVCLVALISRLAAH